MKNSRQVGEVLRSVQTERRIGTAIKKIYAYNVGNFTMTKR